MVKKIIKKNNYTLAGSLTRIGVDKADLVKVTSDHLRTIVV